MMERQRLRIEIFEKDKLIEQLAQYITALDNELAHIRNLPLLSGPS